MPQRARFNSNTAALVTKEYLIKASIWDQMAMAKDDGDRYYHATFIIVMGPGLHLFMIAMQNFMVTKDMAGVMEQPIQAIRVT